MFSGMKHGPNQKQCHQYPKQCEDGVYGPDRQPFSCVLGLMLDRLLYPFLVLLHGIALLNHCDRLLPAGYDAS